MHNSDLELYNAVVCDYSDSEQPVLKLDTKLFARDLESAKKQALVLAVNEHNIMPAEAASLEVLACRFPGF